MSRKIQKKKTVVVDTFPNIDTGMFEKVARTSFPGNVSI